MFQECIEEGIAFLLEQQSNNGSFISLSSTDPDNFSGASQFNSIFPTVLILSCLNKIHETPQLVQIKHKAAAYLLSQKSEDWSFNYWDRKSKEAKTMPYPDDLDDTFCALSVLYEYKRSLLDGAAFARIISLLTEMEVQEGGPYRTWLVSKDSPDVWKDVDIAVNSNIAYFLSLQEIDLPKLSVFIESAIIQSKFSSPYYYSEYPTFYFISRFYNGVHKKTLIDHLLNVKERAGNNPLNNAFIVLALLTLGAASEKVSQNITAILHNQMNGIWKPYAFYIDPVIKGKRHYAGSAALTTAYCLYALVTYADKVEKGKGERKLKIAITVSNRIHNKVVNVVKRRFSRIDSNMKNKAVEMIMKTIQEDKGNQITLLPYYINQSVSATHQNVYENLLVRLGTASLYGWIAYTYYDNFLDDEGIPITLPIANIALRELTTIFTTVLKDNQEFTDFFHKTMDALEAANSWEVTNCRLQVNSNSVNISDIQIPDYGKYNYLANRSMGHALAPSAVLFAKGYTQDSHEVKLLLKFFKHYIIARQLNDDTHDFEDDFKKGHINAVGAAILIDLKKSQKKLPDELSKLLPLVHEYFWNVTVVSICKDILINAKTARKAIMANNVIKDKRFFESMIMSVESSANKALEGHTKVKSFLKAYKKK